MLASSPDNSLIESFIGGNYIQDDPAAGAAVTTGKSSARYGNDGVLAKHVHQSITRLSMRVRRWRAAFPVCSWERRRPAGIVRGANGRHRKVGSPGRMRAFGPPCRRDAGAPKDIREMQPSIGGPSWISRLKYGAPRPIEGIPARRRPPPGCEGKPTGCPTSRRTGWMGRTGWTGRFP